MSSNGRLALSEVRARAGAALAPAQESDPDVHLDYPDAIQPPALLVLWADPWLEPATVQGFLGNASMRVLCLAGRVETGPGIDKVEQLVEFTIGRLRADGYTWTLSSLEAPQRFDIAQITYLGANVIYRVPVTP